MKTDNELIAEFMNPEVIEGFYDSYGKQIAHYYMKLPHGDRTRSYHAADMPMSEFIKRAAYKSSWDWLMPVVQKIQKLWAGVGGAGELGRAADKVLLRHIDDRIDVIYFRVVKFIKWYNTQK